ncbi:MAG: hypothetical protein WAO00_19555 [Chthoniobacterales bacterium]
MPPGHPTKARQITAWIVVVVTVLAVWAYVDYRGQPPPTPARPAAVIGDQLVMSASVTR